MWNEPWGYKEGVMMGAGLLVTGCLLQVTVGGIEWGWMAFPVNVIVLFLFLASLGVMHAFRRKVYGLDWLGRYPAAVSSLCWAVGMTVVMGCFRMFSSWPFVLLYAWMTVVLGMTVLRAGFPFRWRKVPFLLNHTGLFVVLVAAALGHADMRRLRMTAFLGRAEWRAQDEATRQMVELPWAIELKAFVMDEYPPALMLADNMTGKALPEKAPVRLSLEEGVDKGVLLDWDVMIVCSIPEAACVVAEDTLMFTESRSEGAVYAVYLKVTNRKTGRRKEGWVSCGSFMFPCRTLKLDEQVSLVMPEREPQRFASEVVWHTESGLRQEGTVEVNKPFELDGWKMYQSGYDETRGRWSEVSVFELVRDPWLPYVYIGMGLMISGAVCLLVTAQPGRRKEERG